MSGTTSTCLENPSKSGSKMRTTQYLRV
jgi:hypothetical protein